MVRQSFPDSLIVRPTLELDKRLNYTEALAVSTRHIDLLEHLKEITGSLCERYAMML